MLKSTHALKEKKNFFACVFGDKMCDLKKKYNSIMILMPREKYCYRFGGFPFTPYIYSKDCFMQL